MSVILWNICALSWSEGLFNNWQFNNEKLNFIFKYANFGTTKSNYRREYIHFNIIFFHKIKLKFKSRWFLADRTNGRARAYTTMLRLSVVCNVCIAAKRCVLEQKVLLTAYRKSYMRNRSVPNEWHWPLFRGRIRSCESLRHIRHWISRKPLEIETWSKEDQ